MKKSFSGVIILLICLTISTFSIAQNQSNLIDTTGNIGIGVMQPSHKLEVNGNTRLDSTLEVRDSAVFRKKVRVEQDVIIEGKTFMRDNGIANQNFRVQNGFRVDGISQFYNNVSVDSTFRVEGLGLFNQNVRVNGQFRTYGINNLFGTSRFHDEVRLMNLNDPTGQNQEGFMMLNGNGKVERKDIIDLDTINANQYVLTIDENGKIKKTGLLSLMNIGPACEGLGPVGGPYQDVIPNWTREPGIIWTGVPCLAKVGIGTDNPLYQLDVEGVINTNKFRIENNLSEPIFTTLNQSPGTNFLILNRNSTSLNFRATSSPNFNGEWGIEYNANEGGLNFWKPWPNTSGYGNYFLFLRNDGNVGIGTPTPKYKLSVEGIIGAREIIVETAAWNDIVFEDDYPLMPLSEVKSFIKENKHLPEIPSEKEVIKEGVALKEMVSLQMKKIEELTLYVIDQQEKIEELQKQIEAIKAEGGQ